MIAAVYARKSNEQNAPEEQRSVTLQVDRAHEYAERQGWTVDPAHVYMDDGVSGAEFESRAGLMALLASLKPRAPFGALVVYDKDRIGREQFETSYLLKKIDQAGVRVFEAKGGGRALVFDSPIDKMVLSVLGFAEELERDKARTRTRDALQRKAARGYVAGGRCFAYDNVGIADQSGRRSHVVRRVNEGEAVVVRRIFTLTAEGLGLKRIAHTLNAEGAASPLPRREGAPRGWAPSSVREVVHRQLYRGVIVWGQRQKRDKWGQKRVTRRDAATWTRGHDESLRIVSDKLWEAAHERLARQRSVYLRGTSGRLWGRPANGIERRWLLTGFGRCGRCGGTMEVRSLDYRHRGRDRFFYQCASYLRRGTSVCTNRLTLPVEPAHDAVLDAIEADVLHPDVVAIAIREALEDLRRPRTVDAAQDAELQAELRQVDEEIRNLTATVRAAGPLPSVVAALQAAEHRKAQILRTLKPPRAVPADAARLQALLGEWRDMFRANVGIARQILAQLLDGERVVFTPRADGAGWDFSASCTLDRVSIGAGIGAPQRLVTPAGFPQLSERELRVRLEVA